MNCNQCGCHGNTLVKSGLLVKKMIKISKRGQKLKLLPLSNQ